MATKKKEFAMVRVERYLQTVTKIIRAESYDQAVEIAENMKGIPDPKKLELEEVEVTVVGEG